MCLGVVFLVILTFAFAISGMEREVSRVSGEEWINLGARLSTLIRLSFGAMDLGEIQNVAHESPLLILAPRRLLKKAVPHGARPSYHSFCNFVTRSDSICTRICFYSVFNHIFSLFLFSGKGFKMF